MINLAPGWLNRQVAATFREVASWPGWMWREAKQPPVITPADPDPIQYSDAPIMASEALEVTTNVAGVIEWQHALGPIFKAIREASSSGQDWATWKAEPYLCPEQRKALIGHLTELGYTAVIFGRADNMLCVRWGPRPIAPFSELTQ